MPRNRWEGSWEIKPGGIITYDETTMSRIVTEDIQRVLDEMPSFTWNEDEQTKSPSEQWADDWAKKNS